MPQAAGWRARSTPITVDRALGQLRDRGVLDSQIARDRRRWRLAFESPGGKVIGSVLVIWNFSRPS
jgi:hypothetical protein